MNTSSERLEAAVTALQKYADEIDAKGGPASAEEIAQLTRFVGSVEEEKASYTAEAAAEGSIAEARAFMKQLGGDPDADAPEGKSERFTTGGLPMDPRGKTLGQMFVESAEYQAFSKAYVRGGMIPNSMKGIQSSSFQLPDSKALLTGASSTSGGAFVVNDRYSPVTDLVGERELTVYDLVTKGSTQSDTVDYARVTAKTNSAAATAEATSSASPTTGSALSGPLTLNAGGGYKPESSLAFEQVSAAVRTIAHWIPLTKRAAADAGQVRTYVDAFLLYGLAEVLENEMLNGAGSGEHFTGILQTSGIQTVGSAGTDIDAVVDAIAAIRVTGRLRPNALVINPSDWYSTGFLTAKDSNLNYIVGDPRASIDQLNTLWGLKVVVTEALAANTALVGDFSKAFLWEREAPAIMVADQHADFFIRNLLAVLAEQRAAFGVLDPEAFCTITAV